MNFINGDVIEKYQLDSIDFCNAPPNEIENFLSGLTRIICKENKYLKRINVKCEVARHYTFTEATKDMIMQDQCHYEDKIASVIEKKEPKFCYHAMVLKILLRNNFKLSEETLRQKDYCKIFDLRTATISKYINDIELLNQLKHCLWDIEKSILV